MLKVAMLIAILLLVPRKAVQVEATPRKARANAKVKPKETQERRENVHTVQNGTIPKNETSLIV